MSNSVFSASIAHGAPPCIVRNQRRYSIGQRCGVFWGDDDSGAAILDKACSFAFP